MTTTARPLDRRRDKAGTATAAADQADAAVTDIDRQLETVGGLTQQQEQALQRAVEEAARLKRSLKAAGKRHNELVKHRKAAAAKAERARARAVAAESRYDQEVLADLVRREKEKDRATAKTPGKELEPAGAIPARAAVKPQAPPAARASRQSAAADPPPERQDEATETSRRTAARKTAKAARLIR